MANLKLVSININGLQSSLPPLLQFIIKNGFHLIFLQETHVIHFQTLKSWAQKYNFEILLNSRYGSKLDPTFKSGTAIIINLPSFNIPPSEIEHNVIISNRAQALTLKVNDSLFRFVNLYLHTGNSPRACQLRTHSIETIQDFLIENPSSIQSKLYVLGDFNFVLSPNDRTGNYRPNTKDKIRFLRFLQDHNLVDSFRSKHPDKISYSYFSPKSASRLDRIYMTLDQVNTISKADYITCSFSDHSQIPTLQVKLSALSINRSTYWKLNDSLLSKPTSKSAIKIFISLLIEKTDPFASPIAWWDKFKIKIAKYLQFLSIRENKALRLKENALKQKLECSSPRPNPGEIYSIQLELKKIQRTRLSGAVVRSQNLLFLENEEPPVESLAVEQRKQKRQTISEITNSSSDIITDPTQIANSFYVFYDELCNRAPPPCPNDSYLSDIKLLSEDSLSLLPSSSLISKQEVSSAIASLNRHAAPGCDGLTATFYISFPSLTKHLRDVFNNMLFQNKMTPSQRQALIKLIPKLSRPKTVKDFRPISLLNVDYKILATIIATRLKLTLQHYISPDQQCGLPNRHIFNNHLNIKSALEYASDISHPLAIIQIDFKKAFDSISHQFILDTAQQIGIPSSLSCWFKIILSNIYSKLIINGQQTDPIPIKRGIRQGCPLSMLLFILGLEPLSQKINNSPLVNGFSIGNTHIKISQYADDVILFLTDPQSITEIHKIFQDFYHHSGLEISPPKTKIISNSPTLISTFKSTFPDGKVLNKTKILGITFSFEPELMQTNWKEMTGEIRRLCISNTHKNISIYGKTAIINSTVLPRIIFLARILYPKRKHVKILTRTVFEFLWNHERYEPLKREALYRSKLHGGIGFPCIEAKINTAFLWQLTYLLNKPDETLFWIHYAKYSLGTKIKLFDSSLYTNSMPHRPMPNQTWNSIVKLCQTKTLPTTTLSQLNFKQLYTHLLNLTPLPMPPISAITLPKNWLRISLHLPKNTVFSVRDKEIAYRTAHKAYLWGSFFEETIIPHTTNTQPKDNTLKCKLCKVGRDHPHHLFYECPKTRQILMQLEKDLPPLINPSSKINKVAMIYNETSLNPTEHLKLIKLCAIIRMELFKFRNAKANSSSATLPCSLPANLNAQTATTSKNFSSPCSKDCIRDIFWKIKTKFKDFLAFQESTNST